MRNPPRCCRGDAQVRGKHRPRPSRLGSCKRRSSPPPPGAIRPDAGESPPLFRRARDVRGAYTRLRETSPSHHALAPRRRCPGTGSPPASSSSGLTPSGRGRAPGRPPPRTPEESARRLAGAGRGASPPWPSRATMPVAPRRRCPGTGGRRPAHLRASRPLAGAGPPAALPRGRPRSRPGGSRAPAAVPLPRPCRPRPPTAPAPRKGGSGPGAPASWSPGLAPSDPGLAPGRPPPRTPGESARRIACAGRGASPPLAHRGRGHQRRRGPAGPAGRDRGRRPAGRRAWRPPARE